MLPIMLRADVAWWRPLRCQRSWNTAMFPSPTSRPSVCRAHLPASPRAVAIRAVVHATHTIFLILVFLYVPTDSEIGYRFLSGTITFHFFYPRGRHACTPRTQFE